MSTSQNQLFTRRINKTTTCCGCCISNQIGQEPGVYPGYDMVRIKDKCTIRVQHLNKTDRDHNFESQMGHFMKACYKGTRYGHLVTAKPSVNGVLNIESSSVYGSVLDLESGDNSTQNNAAGISNNQNNSAIGRLESGDERLRYDSKRLRTASSVKCDVASVQEGGSKDSSPSHSLGSNTGKQGTRKGTIFFIHGVGGSGDIWKPQADRFSKAGYELVIPDLLGHGFSSTPKDQSLYYFKEISQDLLVVFDLYCKPKNIVVGHSYGSCFAAVIARERLSKVSKLIMINGGSPTPLAPQPGLFTLPICVLGCLKPILKHGFNKSAFNQKKTFVPKDKAFDIPTYVLKYIMNGQWWPEGTVEYHEQITCPTLLIYGQQDQLVSLNEEEDMKNAIPISELVFIENASHMVMMEKPQEVNQYIQDFVENSTNKETPKHKSIRPQRTHSSVSLKSTKSVHGNRILKSAKGKRW